MWRRRAEQEVFRLNHRGRAFALLRFLAKSEVLWDLETSWPRVVFREVNGGEWRRYSTG